MAANDVDLLFRDMDEAELRQWVEANPGRVNGRDKGGYTPLFTAVFKFDSAPLILWLVKDP